MSDHSHPSYLYFSCLKSTDFHLFFFATTSLLPLTINLFSSLPPIHFLLSSTNLFYLLPSLSSPLLSSLLDVARRLLITGISNFPHSKNIGWFYAALASLARQDGKYRKKSVYVYACLCVCSLARQDGKKEKENGKESFRTVHYLLLYLYIFVYLVLFFYLHLLLYFLLYFYNADNLCSFITSHLLNFHMYTSLLHFRLLSCSPSSSSLLPSLHFPLGDLITARSCYSRAVEATPPQLSLQVLLDYAKMEAYLGEKNLAIKLFEVAVKRFPTHDR